MHALRPLITTLAAAFGLALVLGFVADLEIAGELAEIGVMLLMFGVGLHFLLEDPMSLRRIAVPGAVLQIVAATVLRGHRADAAGAAQPLAARA